MDHANLFLSNTQKAENSRLKKPVGQNFVIFFCFCLKRVGGACRQKNKLGKT